MHRPDRGHCEVEHTADWELAVWGPGLAELLEEAASGMYGLMGVKLEEGPRRSAAVTIDADDREQLVVQFLEELLYLAENEGVAFDGFRWQIAGTRLRVSMDGARIRALTKEVKAVTYHRLTVEESDRGFETRIVFDV